MNRQIRLTLALIVAAQGAVAQQAAPDRAPRPSGEVLTLERAISLAVEHNRGLQIAQLEKLKADDQVAVARTHRLPQTDVSILASQLLTKLSFEFDKGAFGDFPTTGPIPAKDTRITTPRRPNVLMTGSVQQPLSQLYQISLKIHQAELSRQSREEDVRSQRMALIHRVRSLYYSAQQTQAAMEASRDAIAFYREMDRLAGNLLAQQAALKSDQLDVRARLAKEEYEALTLENQLAQLKEQLNEEMGRDIREEFELAPVANAVTLESDLTTARQKALEQRPELRDARLKTKLAEQDRRIQRAEYIPDVSLALNYLSPANINVLPKNITAVGVKLSWEPWDWGRRKREIQEKSRAVEQAELSARETESRVLLEVSQCQRKLREARALIPVTESARESAQEKLRIVKNRYAERAALLKDVLQAQMETAQAAKNYQQALAAFWSARADFEKAIGEDQ
jgi:outer membrane protein TolC